MGPQYWQSLIPKQRNKVGAEGKGWSAHEKQLLHDGRPALLFWISSELKSMLGFIPLLASLSCPAVLMMNADT